MNNRLFRQSMLTPICSAVLVFIATSTAIANNHVESLKILCLHGGGGSAEGLRQQRGMQSLIEDLQAYEFIFANAPDEEGLWIQDPPGGKGEPTTDTNWAAESVSYLNEFVTNNGPFHGILGYSQGSAMATVFLASSNHAFEKVLLFNGYLPTTHEGLIQTINNAQLEAHNALVFAGANDTIINSQLSQELSTKFDFPTFVLSDEAGHHLPEAADPTYRQITAFLAINSTPHDEDQNSTDDRNATSDRDDHAGHDEHDQHTPERQGVPRDEVEGFVGNWLDDKAHYEGAQVMWAEKQSDLASNDNFVYQIGLDNGVALYFDKNKTFLHSAYENEFADHEVEAIKAEDASQNLKDAIEKVHPGAKIVELDKEFSLEPTAEGETKEYIYLAIIEKDGEEFEVALSRDTKVYNTHKHEKSDFEEWKEPKLPTVAADVLREKYKDGDRQIGYWVDERPHADGTMEYVAHLDDEREIIFDANGTEIGVRDPWQERLQKVDAGLKFDVARSKWGTSSNGGKFVKDAEASPPKTNGGSGSDAFVHLKRVETDDEGSMLYRIALMNKSSVEGNASAADFDLGSTVLDANTSLNLTFTYAMGPPRFFAVSGANVTAFKHRRPEWDKPGSFTIQAKTVDPVASKHNLTDSVSSTFGILVEMGGERHHEGAIFVANVIPQDVNGPDLSSPWDPVTGFRLNGLSDANASVKAYLPKQLVQHKFGIWDPGALKTAIAREDGTLSFIDFHRTPFKGYEPDGLDAHSQTEFMLDEKNFGLDKRGEGLASEGTQNDPIAQNGGSTENPNEQDRNDGEKLADEAKKSFIDFDGDGFVDSMLKVSFKNNSWPGEVQLGDPWLDPFANVNLDDFGSISGSVSDTSGNPLKEFGIWIIDVNQTEGEGIYSGKPVFFDLEVNEANGTFVAKVPAGSYYVEASAYDPATDTPYKPKLAGGRKNPDVFTILDANTTLSHNFNLEAEYRVSHEMGEISGAVSSGGESVGGLAIELFPMDENNQSLSDHPVHVLFVEPDGKVRGKAPVGNFRGEIVSWDNSFNDLNVTITVEASGLRELPPIELTRRAMATVTGRITTEAGNGTWAEVLFVDPDDENEMTWPMEFEVEHNESTGAPSGRFTAKVPAGSYKILAQRFDGTLIPAYYTSGEGNAAGFATAETVQITDAGVSGIDIRLESRPTATVKVQVIDLNNSPVKYAWFLFHDAEDEEGETVFPEVHPVKPFEADDFNGSYVLKVPGGTYKVEVEADGHVPAFRILNESGTEAWLSTEWEKGAPVTLTDGNTTTLAKATLKAFEKTEAERFGFAWMELDDEDGPDAGPFPVVASISGTVKTKDGTAVPKARIIAHTKDYLLWLDHVNTRADGSFELKNLPARDDWIVFAEPPFDSEAFRGFRESHAKDINVMEANASGLALVLQSSNVSGKILFPRKDQATGKTRNAPLAHAHIWAYQDDDGDGEPDFDFDDVAGSQEPINFNEAFGETDEKGIFSFNLQETGQYALQIDLPGQLSALRPEPISFNVRNPDRDLNLGNAIKISWEYRGATAFDIKRKASTESSLTSIFTSSSDDKPNGEATSYVDVSITPGETYEYQVSATTKTGNTDPLPSTDVKVSKPFIFLAPPKKTITGYVFDDSNNTVSGAEVLAWREEGEGWSSSISAGDGSFELVAGPGKWEVTVYRPHDVKDYWIYDQEPKRVGFKKDSAKESKRVNFTVRKAAGGKVTGRIAVPAGKTWADIYEYVSVDAFDHEGQGNWTDLDLDSNGSFEIPLQPGNYEVSLWVAPELKGFGSSEVKFVRVGKTSVSLKDFSLESRNSKIEGLVKTDTGKALPNVEVWAWSEKGGWVSDVTNVNGTYALTVSPGQWEVGFELLPAEDGSAPPYLPAPPKRVKLRNDQTSSINFTAKEAGASVKGVVYAAGKAATDIDVWAYARNANTGEEFDQILAEVPVDSRGKFDFPGVPGEYLVGLWMPPGSGYVNPAEKYLQLDFNGTFRDSNGTTLTEIAFNLEANDAVVSGTLKLNGAGVTGLSGEVHAAKGDGGGWQTTPIEDNGTFSMTLSPGRWTLGYFIESDEQNRNLPQHPPEPIEVIALKGETVSKDFSLRSASASISGSILDEHNASITSGTVFVWAHREGTGTLDEFWKEVETDDNGTFSIPVLPGGEYEIGTFLPDDLRKGGYLESKVKTVDLSTNITGLSLPLGKLVENNFVKGTIRDDSNTSLGGAYVYAWSDDGRVIEGESDENGSYELKVPKGTVWHVGADYGETDDNGSETIYLTENELDVDLRDADSQSDLNLTLTKPDIKVPEGTNGTFDPTKDFVTKLPDGTEVTIPGGAANVPSTETSVRAVVTPTIKGLTKTAKDQPTSYAYSIELFDSSGKKVEGNFKKDVILKIPVNKNATLAKGLDPDNMEAKFYSTTKNSWDSLKSSTYDSSASVIYATTDHFTNIATVSNASVSALANGLAKIDTSGASGDWYNLPWLGNFYDALEGWVYHETHGWLYSADAGSGNFWFYDAELGWFWTGSTYYDESSTSQAEYLYSSTHAGWLYFTSSNGKRKFFRYSDTKWINADGSDFTE